LAVRIRRPRALAISVPSSGPRRRGISTATIAARIDAGETVDALAADCDLSPAEIEHAVLYERVA